jgi:hypothetical protein
MSEKVLSNTWWPVATYADGIPEVVLDKIMALWLNSSLGLLSLMAARVDTRGAWVDLKKPTLENLLVLDPRKLRASAREKLCDTYDEVKKLEIQPLPQIAIDAVREKIDNAIAVALRIHQDFGPYRKLLGTEPVISGRLPI